MLRQWGWKSAIAVARLYAREQNFTGEHLWARGYAVSTVGFELEQIRHYIRDQEEADGAGGRFSRFKNIRPALAGRQDHLG